MVLAAGIRGYRPSDLVQTNKLERRENTSIVVHNVYPSSGIYFCEDRQPRTDSSAFLQTPDKRRWCSENPCNHERFDARGLWQCLVLIGMPIRRHIFDILGTCEVAFVLNHASVLDDGCVLDNPLRHNLACHLLTIFLSLSLLTTLLRGL